VKLANANGRAVVVLGDRIVDVAEVSAVLPLLPGDVVFTGTPAARCLSPAAARTVVERSTEDTIANDVEWPLVVEAAGLDLAWFAADGLDYRVRQDFDAPADGRDHDPAEWIERVELDAGHVRVLKAARA
jgi:hypothetical protein